MRVNAVMTSSYAHGQIPLRVLSMELSLSHIIDDIALRNEVQLSYLNTDCEPKRI